MYLTDYCSEYLRDIYGICTCFNGEYKDQYLYALDDIDYIEKIHDYLMDFKPSNDLAFDSGFVMDFKCKDMNGYVVIQSLYNSGSNGFIGDVLQSLSEYTKELVQYGAKEIEVIDSYSEIDSTLHSFDIAFFIPKASVDYNLKIEYSEE